MDIWFQDEARFGQRNTISRVWAEKGSRPGLIRQQQYEYAYVFGAVCPALDKGIALVLPRANSECLALHLNEVDKATKEGHHAIVLMDNAGFHISKELPEYDNLSIVYLPPYSPELNAAERLWEWMREHDLSNRCFACYEDIVEACSNAWNKLCEETGRIASLCSKKWAIIP